MYHNLYYYIYKKNMQVYRLIFGHQSIAVPVYRYDFVFILIEAHYIFSSYFRVLFD